VWDRPTHETWVPHTSSRGAREGLEVLWEDTGRGEKACHVGLHAKRALLFTRLLLQA
jgi:hypothetical protein